MTEQKLSRLGTRAFQSLQEILKHRPPEGEDFNDWEIKKHDAIINAEEQGVPNFLIQQTIVASLPEEERFLYFQNQSNSSGLGGLTPIEYARLVKQFGKK